MGVGLLVRSSGRFRHQSHSVGFREGASQAPPIFITKTAQMGGLCILCKSFNAVGADLDATSANFGPLKVGLLTSLTGGIVVTTQKDAAGNHARTFLAVGAFDGHIRVYKTLAWT